MKKIRILLADDHQMFKDGIKSILSEDNEIEIIGEAKNGEELINLNTELKPDLIIADISMPIISGIEATKSIKSHCPETKILILSMHNTSEFIINAIEAGTNGFLPKDTNQQELILAIKSIYQGKNYFNQNITNSLINNFSKTKQNTSTNPKEVLSKREIEVLKLFCEGYSNSEIAQELFISLRTVESHKTHIMTKLNLKSQVEMVKIAIKHKLIEL